MAYPQGKSLGKIITSYSEVSDAGLQHAESLLTDAQRANATNGATTTASRLPDPFQQAAADGVASYADAQALWNMMDAHLATAIAQQPTLAGLLVAWDAVNSYTDTPGLSPERALNNLITPGGTPGYYTGRELPPSLSPAQLAPYLDAVEHYFALFLADKAQAGADVTGQRDALVSSVLAYARGNLAQHGSTLLGNGVSVPTELIRDHVVLPDGVEYAVLDDVTGDPANRYVYRWNGPGFRTQQGSFMETPGGVVCVDVVKGTGNWYEAIVFGQVQRGSSCDATPDTFTGPWNLITPDMAAAMTYQDGSPVVLVTPSGGGGGGGGSSLPVIVQDEAGNPLPGTPIDGPATSPVIVNMLPTPSTAIVPAGGGGTTPAVAQGMPFLALAVIGVAAIAYLSRGRR